MANIQTGNIWFVDTASESLSHKNIRLVGMIVHCTHATNAAALVLGDNLAARSYPTLINIEVPAASDFADFDFSSRPIVFPSGIRIVTLTNAQVTLIVDRNVQDVR